MPNDGPSSPWLVSKKVSSWRNCSDTGDGIDTSPLDLVWEQEICRNKLLRYYSISVTWRERERAKRAK